MSTLEHRIWVLGLALSAMTGALLATGCEARGDAGDLGAGAYTKKQHAEPLRGGDLGKAVAEADRGAQREIEQAQKNSALLPVEARERLAAAIDRAEDARDEANHRLDELNRAGAARGDDQRERVIEALDELSAARREVVSALAGGQPSLSDG
jgi:hypothetical protein